MKRNLVRMFLSVCLVIMAGLSIGATPLPMVSRSAPIVIQTVLDRYSSSISENIDIQNDARFSPGMKALALERKSFYKKYFDEGLNISLTSIKSKFIGDTIQITETGSTLTVQVEEVVSLKGETKIKSAETYPPVKAYSWAIKNAPSERIAQALANRKQLLVEAVNKSITEGVEINIYLHHEMNFHNQGVSLILDNDNYSDDAQYEEGIDNVKWSENVGKRKPIDFSATTEAKVNKMSSSEAGELLLQTFLTQSESSYTIASTYSHANAVSYINTWVKATSKTCPTNSNVYQDPDNYNSSYQYFDCNDCQNYVSQALHAGGISTDSTWAPYNYAWISVPSFKSWLTSSGHGRSQGSVIYLVPGDLGFVSDSHVVMVTGASPYKYSGHSNDRLNASWSASINSYWIIY